MCVRAHVCGLVRVQAWSASSSIHGSCGQSEKLTCPATVTAQSVWQCPFLLAQVSRLLIRNCVESPHASKDYGNNPPPPERERGAKIFGIFMMVRITESEIQMNCCKARAKTTTKYRQKLPISREILVMRDLRFNGTPND